ncbi:fungal-specific transcription factor domain-containing protein [Fusarium oxysporum]|nr:fungal-specific transcription factor domain-containing protein [Fusarium oxysporum]
MSVATKRPFKVRFANGSKYQKAIEAHEHEPSACQISFPSHSTSRCKESSKPQRTKSRLGCLECRIRRVKCDETFPVCLRCQRRGSVCMASNRPARWRIEMPWLSNMALLNSWPADNPPNKRLVQYWIEQVSQGLCIDKNHNPLALPLLPYMVASPSLLHAIQSISAGHEVFFNDRALTLCLQERGHSMRLVREELQVQDSETISITSILTVFLLGVSSSWIESRPESWGKEHLDGARALIKVILAGPRNMAGSRNEADPLIQLLYGWFLYWDMTCSILDDPDNVLNQGIPTLGQDPDCFHPMIGFSSELYSKVADVGRHCRRLYDRGHADPDFDDGEAERQLLAWLPTRGDKYIRDLSCAYRNHGLLMLYEARHLVESSDTFSSFDKRDGHDQNDNEPGSASNIRSLALQTIESMLETPLTEPCVNYQSLPLLSAAAELTSADTDLRNKVISRYKALYSLARFPIYMRSVQLLEELWPLRDCGLGVSWLDLSLTKGWKLCYS